MRKLLLLLGSLLLLSGPTLAAPAHVQSFSKEVLTNTVETCKFPGNVAAGNLIIAGVRISSTSLTPTVTDDDSNTYTLVTSQVQTTDGHTQWVFYAKNVGITPNAAITVSFTVSSNTNFRCAIDEVSGLDTTSPLDQFNSNQGSSTTPDSNTVSTTVASEFAWGGCSASINPAPWTAGSGYTLRETVNSYAMETQVLASTQTLSASCTMNTTGNWTAIIVTFKAAGGASPKPPGKAVII